MIKNLRPSDLFLDINAANMNNKPLVIRQSLTSYRKAMKAIIDHVDEVLFPSNAAKNIALQVYEIKNYIRVIPHDNSTENASKICFTKDINFNECSRIKIAVIGAIGGNKGAYTLFDICRYIYEHNFPIDIYVVGFTCNDNEIKYYSFVHIVCKYDE